MMRVRNLAWVGMVFAAITLAGPTMPTQAQQARDTTEAAANILVRDGSRTWNAQSIRSVDIVDLALATVVLDADRPEISSRMLPQVCHLSSSTV